MQEHHGAESLFENPRCAVRKHIALVFSRNSQFDDAKNSDEGHERDERNFNYAHSSSNISALNPGPKAAISPFAPAGNFVRSSVSCNT